MRTGVLMLKPEVPVHPNIMLPIDPTLESPGDLAPADRRRLLARAEVCASLARSW